MTDPNVMRQARQRLQAERLLGVESVPIHRLDPAGLATPAARAEPAAAVVGGPVATFGGAQAQDPPGPDTGRKPGATGALSGGAQAQDAPPALAPSTAPRLDRPTKLSILAAMDEKEVRACTKCGLCAGRTQTVFGEGDVDAQIMFIGEGPGQTEDEQGRPFVGRAGELLNNMIAAMHLQRQQVYIANVVKCRPPNNRTPTPQEVDTCWDYLLRQIETIQPRVIVTLGGPATKKVCQTDRGITSIRGTWQTLTTSPGVPPLPVMPTFHPAYLLRNYTPDTRGKVWADLKKVMALVGLK